MRNLYHWFLGLVGAIAFHIVLIWLATFAGPFASESVAVRDEGMTVEVLSEIPAQMALFDPRPMLVPTRWNVSNARDVGEVVDEELSIFDAYEYRFAKEEGGFINSYGNSWGTGLELRDVQLVFDFPQLDQMGRGAVKQVAARSQVLHVRLRDPKTGTILHEEELMAVEMADLSVQWPGWSPATFWVTVADSFFMHGFMVLDSSGYQEMDLLLEKMTKDGLKTVGIWPDGSYLLEVGL